MRQFKILKYPNGHPEVDLSKPYRLLKEFLSLEMDAPVYCLDVDGRKMYFYENEVKEVKSNINPITII